MLQYHAWNEIGHLPQNPSAPPPPTHTPIAERFPANDNADYQIGVLSLFLLYGKSNVICTQNMCKANMAINNMSRKFILFIISIMERYLEFKPLLVHTTRC